MPDDLEDRSACPAFQLAPEKTQSVSKIKFTRPGAPTTLKHALPLVICDNCEPRSYKSLIVGDLLIFTHQAMGLCCDG